MGQGIQTIHRILKKKKKNPSKCLKENSRVFSGGPVFKKPPCNTGGLGLISGGGTKILHAVGCD